MPISETQMSKLKIQNQNIRICEGFNFIFGVFKF